MPDKVGQQIGKYRLVRLLGRGGFAEVYLGQHVHLDARQAAIKILHLTDVDVEAFKKEAETTVQLEHPHIVRLLDFDIEQGTPFLVLDFAPGGSLRARHPKGSIVPLASVVDYLKEIAPALQHAHNQRILHQDIKPDNMLIGRQGELLLSDFGIAVLLQSTRNSQLSPSGVEGTPYYMAPETYRGKSEKASDQYSLGIVVYEWLAGTTPFTKGNFIQLGYQHCYEETPPLREKNPAISPDVAAVVMTALSKDPQKRFGSVSAFANAFEQACLSSRQALPRVESTPSQSTSAWMTTNQSTPQREAVAQQFEQRAAPMQPVSQKNASIPPPPPAQSTDPYPPHYTYTPQVNPYPYVHQMPSVQRPYIQSPAELAKQRHTRNKRNLVFGGIGGGAVGGALAMGIDVAKLNAGNIVVSSDWVITEGINNTILGAVIGAILGGIALVVLRIFLGKEALRFSGVIEVIIVTIVGIIAGAIGVGVSLYFGPAVNTAFLVLAVVAVVAGVVAGAAVVGIVRKKSALSSKSS
jgi:serine/threonine protein kinase